MTPDDIRDAIYELVPLWQERMGLGHFKIRSSVNESANSEDDATKADVTSLWHYLQADISFYLPMLVQLSRDEIEDVVVHELSHVLHSSLNGIPSRFEDHAELACEMTARAILRGWRQ